MTQPTYPLDTTGAASTNFIQAEMHTLSEINEDTYRIIIPVCAPFFINNFKLYLVEQTGNKRVLFEDVDYSFCLPFVGATRSIGTPVYGGIKIISELANGTLGVDYQTIGDKWVGDAAYVIKMLTEASANPRIAYWDNITNVQETFPPINHTLDVKDTYGYEKLVEAVNLLSAAVLAGPNTSLSALKHLIDESNPHKTNKDQIGLPNVQNLPVATVEEIRTGLNKQAYLTLENFNQGFMTSVLSRLSNIENRLGIS